jgi:glycerophosphodiester phosphodiesterase
MLFEAHDWKMDTYAVELNHLVNTVLDKVYRLAGNRTIFLSSFSPEICILLSTKQNVYPVFFLTESGHIISADARADSLQEAIHFARSWRLPGVICRSQPLVISPDLVRYVKDSGLLCISWGELNDEPEHAKVKSPSGFQYHHSRLHTSGGNNLANIWN